MTGSRAFLDHEGMTDLTPGREELELDAVFYALSDSRRREMVERLSGDPTLVKDLAGPLGMRRPSAVKSLAVLEAGGLVASEEIGRVRTYRMKAEAFDRVRTWIATRDVELGAAFDRPDRAIAEVPEDADG